MSKTAQQCQWMEGVQMAGFSAWERCRNKRIFQVLCDGVLVGHVCYRCSRKAESHGWKVKPL